MTKQPLDPTICANWALASAETATSHLEAAKILLDNGRWPQAQALAVYAYEEVGKAVLRLTEMLSPDALAQFWRQGDAEKEQHVRKLSAAQVGHVIVEVLHGQRRSSGSALGFATELDRLARGHHAVRNRSLYADLRKDQISKPSMVAEPEARRTVGAVQSAHDAVIPLVAVTATRFLSHAVDPALTDFLGRAAEAFQGGDAAMAEFAKQELKVLDSVAEIVKILPPDALDEILRALSEPPEPPPDAHPDDEGNADEAR